MNKINNHDVEDKNKNLFAKLAKYKKFAKVQYIVKNIQEEK